MKQTFKDISDLSREMTGYGIDGIKMRVSAVLASAELNAHDTIYVEKAATEDQFDAIALATLEGILCFCEDFEVCQWFAENDVKW